MAMPFGIGNAIVISGSMEPGISVDDMIIVKKCDDYELRDIVVYESNDGLTVHRIVERDGNIIVTKGDANDTKDAPISLSQIKGKVIFTIPFVGKIVRFARSSSGLMIICLIVVAILIFSFNDELEDTNLLTDKQKNTTLGLLLVIFVLLVLISAFSFLFM